MKRLLELNKTYRVPHEDGGTRLLKIMNISSKYVWFLDLKTKRKIKQSRSSFQKRLDDGEVYVSASMKLISALKKLVVAEAGRPEEFKYTGSSKLWVHMLYKGEEESLLSSGQVPKINAEVAMTSFDPAKLFHKSAGAGRIGYVFQGKPTFHFPSDAHSVRSPDGTRRCRLTEKERKEILTKEPEEEYNWDEAWVIPAKSKLIGILCVTEENNLKNFVKSDKEGVDLLKKSPTKKNFVKTKTGKIFTYNR